MKRQPPSNSYYYPAGEPEPDYAELCIRHSRFSDLKIARITFVPLKDVAKMRARIEAEGRGR